MSKKFHLNTLIAAAALSLLAACGGSDDPPPPLDPQGIWTGTIVLPADTSDQQVKTDTTMNVVALITDSGKLWMFGTDAEEPTLPSLLAGPGSATGSIYTANAFDHDPDTMYDGQDPVEMTFKGVVENQTAMRVTLTAQDEEEEIVSPVFTLNSDVEGYNQASDVEDLVLEGGEQWQVPDADATVMHFLITNGSITPNGTRTTASFSGQYGNGDLGSVICTFTGEITANDKNYYGITFTVNTGINNCEDDDLVFTGVGVVRGENNDRVLYIGAETGDGKRTIFAPLKIVSSTQ
jgi:hypothetical protein